MSFEWTIDAIIQLIEAYQTFECLWNPKDIKYKCRNAKHDAWAELSTIISADRLEVQKKIKNMTAQFYRERKKHRLSQKSGSGTSNDSKWFAYKYMLFLEDKNRVRPCTEKGLNETVDVLNISETNTDDGECQSPGSTPSDIIDVTSLSQIDEGNENDMQASRSGEVENSENMFERRQEIVVESEKIPRFKSPRMEQTRKRKQNLSSDARQEEAYAVLKQIQNKKPRNRFHVFGEHVGLKIESLRTEYAQNTVEHLISNILWEASMGKYDQPLHVDTFQHNVPGQYRSTMPQPTNTQMYHLWASPTTSTQMPTISPVDSYISSYTSQSSHEHSIPEENTSNVIYEDI